MKKIKFFAFLLVLLVGFAFSQSVYASEGRITVNGAGSVSLEAEFITLRIGVSTERTAPQEALLENNRATAAVIAALKAHGVDEGDIATDNFTLSPTWDWERSSGTISGYRISNTVSAVIRNIDAAGDIIGAAVAAGANVTASISFGAADTTEAYNQALALAVQDAAAKAQTLANALNVSIASIHSVTELSGFNAPMMTRAAAPMLVAESADWGVPIEAGNITVTARVEIIYNIR